MFVYGMSKLSVATFEHLGIEQWYIIEGWNYAKELLEIKKTIK